MFTSKDYQSRAGEYFRVYLGLMLLLALTFGAAYVPLGPFNVVAAFGIALVKAVLVVLFFMGVRSGSKLIWVFSLGGLLWLGILFSITFSDYATRGWSPGG